MKDKKQCPVDHNRIAKWIEATTKCIEKADCLYCGEVIKLNRNSPKEGESS